MRSKIIFIVLTMVFLGPRPSQAQLVINSAPSSLADGLKRDPSRNPQTDHTIEIFWTRYKTTVTKGDKEAVSSMVQFPIAMSYGVRTIKPRAELLKRYR